jgi:hypothetical protein
MDVQHTHELSSKQLQTGHLQISTEMLGTGAGSGWAGWVLFDVEHFQEMGMAALLRLVG